MSLFYFSQRLFLSDSHFLEEKRKLLRSRDGRISYDLAATSASICKD